LKKLFKLFTIFVVSLVIVNPTIAKADQLQLHSEAYSKYVSVGSEFIFVVNVGQNYFDGIVTFDNSVLEVKNVKSEPTSEYDVIGPNVGKVSHEVNGSQLKLNFVPDGYKENIYITFKVKEYPSDGTTTVKVKSNDDRWFGEPYGTMNIIKQSDCPSCPVCQPSEKECPECESCEKQETACIDEIKDESKKDNILLYSALGACGVLSIAVLVLAFRKNK